MLMPLLFPVAGPVSPAGLLKRPWEPAERHYNGALAASQEDAAIEVKQRKAAEQRMETIWQAKML
jgi:hypothetical protein